MITNTANTLVLNTVIAVTLDKITHISISNSGGEYFRKAATAITTISPTKRQYTFFIAETEGNTAIEALGLHGNGASTVLNSGTAYATQALILTKTSNQSLNIEWVVELV